MHKIVIDLYGADAGPQVILEGVALALRRNPDFEVVLVGDSSLILSALPQALLPRVAIVDAPDALSNHDAPTSILAADCKCSMRLALEHLRQHDDCVGLLSAGNTGALMLGAIFRLGLVRGMKQPALCSALPLKDGRLVCLVDCGATIDCQPRALAMFALLGDAYMRCMCGLEAPRVALLSVGREPGKGNPLTLAAYPILERLPLHFIGNIEGSDFAAGAADVVVSDGFSGNILLKSTEATGKLAAQLLRQMADGQSPEAADALRTAADRLYYCFDFNSRGGATFLGTKKPIVKMHGCANPETVCACAEQVLRLDAAAFSVRIADTAAQLPETL